MISYVIRRVFLLLPTAIFVTLAVFLLLHDLPGGPAEAIAGPNPTPQLIASINRQLGLNRPLLTQYISFITGALHGQLGTSIITQTPVRTEIAQAMPITIEIAALGLLVATILGLIMGIISAKYEKKLVGHLLTTLSGTAIAIPDFLLAILAVLIFALRLHLLPATGFVRISTSLTGNLRSVLMPITVLGLAVSAVISRQVRGSMLEQLRLPYVSAARALGTPERTIILRLALPNLFVSLLTILGLLLSGLLGGTILIETVFGLPGLGTLIINAVINKDFPVVEGTTLIYVGIVMIVNLAVDLGYGLLDPRIRRAV
jgi:peptide/nickel transport system permease protein